MIADILTKALPRVKFEYLQSLLNGYVWMNLWLIFLLYYDEWSSVSYVWRFCKWILLICSENLSKDLIIV